MKRSFLVLFVVVMAFVLAVGGVAEARAEQVWKLSHVRPQGAPIDKDLHWFADKVAENTDGRIKIEVYPASQLGDYTVVHERISVGAVEMACQPPGVAADKRVQIVYLPYFVTNWEEAREHFFTGSELMKVAADLFARQNIQYLSSYPVYFGGVALSKAPGDAPYDPEVKKNTKVRVPPMKTFQLTAQAMGYQATPIPFSEAFTSLQTGVVNGIVGSGAEGYYNQFRDVIDYYLPANTHFEQWYLYMNKQTFEGLSDEDRQGVLDAAAAFEERRWENAQPQQAKNEQKLADYGVEIVRPEEGQLAEIADKVRTQVWPVIMKDIGLEWANGVMERCGMEEYVIEK
ncbi:MAG: TRAP transporter substrate-binding protein DctP [Synergistales bacterium]|nr:TRAP transporter substrate-binding protein DctP [Synergistales bacterium]